MESGGEQRVLERLKGRVSLERLNQRHSTIRTDVVVLETANEFEHAASEAVDSRGRGVQRRT